MKHCDFIIPENTAIVNGISNSCKLLINDFNASKNNIVVLDYGCGKLRNSKHLISQGFNISITDTNIQIHKQLNLIKELKIKDCFNIDEIDFHIQYDAILVSFVLNVIPNIIDRNKLLKNVYLLLKDNGYAYIEVRNNKFVNTLKNKEFFNDGIITGKNKSKTFQKPYELPEIVQYLESNNFEVVYSKSTSNSIVLKVKKGENYDEIRTNN